MEVNNKIGVLIMAAGKGTRMKSSLPKVLQPMLDRAMIDYLLRSVAVNLNNIVVLVGSGGEQVEEHILKFNSEFKQNIKILWQREQLGTGHAVKCAVDWWKDLDDLIVLNGDLPLLTSQTLDNLINKFNLNKPDCAVITFVAENPGAYGRIIRENNNKIRIVEFKDANEAERGVKEVNAGCYFFTVKSLLKVIDNLKNDNAQGEYYLPDVLALMNNENMRVEAYAVSEDEMAGVNTQAELAQVSNVMRKRILEYWMGEGVRMLSPETVWISPDAELSRGVVIMPNVQIWGKSVIKENSYIGSGSILHDAIIGESCELVANVVIENSELKNFVKAGPFVYIRDNALLEDHAFAGKFVEIKNSHIGVNSKVPHLSYMGDATLGHDVNIGAGTITCNYDGEKKNKTIIGDNCFVGSDTMFVAPAQVGDNAVTAAGSVITKPVPEDALAVGRARQVNIDGWVKRK